MKVDIVYPVFNRLAFTKLSFSALIENTNWQLVNHLYVYDDVSTDGTTKWIHGAMKKHAFLKVGGVYNWGHSGSPVAVMNDYLQEETEAVDVTHFVKIDNDVVVPPGWLERIMDHHQQFPEIDLLGIEPPMSRLACAPWFQGTVQMPEYSTARPALCDAIGGIGLMRRGAFANRAAMKPFATYGGFTNWQTENPEVTKAWIKPALDKLFLLDRVPLLRELSDSYIASGWQRPWTMYGQDIEFMWRWYLTSERLQLLANCADGWPL